MEDSQQFCQVSLNPWVLRIWH